MILAIQCVIACIVFTLLVVPMQYKNPIKYIMSYPTAIRKRVESLPQYQSTIHKEEKKHISIKIIAVFLFAIVLALTAYFSGARNFSSAYFHVFMLFFAVNLYDMLVLDIGLFCHSQKLRIPGTEDMDKEYKSPWFHVIGAVKGTVIGAVVALFAGGIVSILTIL